MLGRLADLWKSILDRGIAGVFLLKGVIIVLSFVLITVASRVLGTDSFGTYSMLFSAAGLLCIVATFGQQILLMRSWNEYVAANEPGYLKGALIFGAVTCLIGSAVTAIAAFAWISSIEGTILALAVSVYLALLAMVQTSSHLVRTAIGVGAGDGYGNLLTIALPIVYLMSCWATGSAPSLEIVFFLFALGALLALLIHLVMLWHKVRAVAPGFAATPARFDAKKWTARSLRLWVSNGLEAANQYLDVLVVGTLMTPSVAGAYFVTTRLANAFATAADAMHMFSTRHIPDYYFRDATKPLGELLDSVARTTLIITIAGLVLIALGGQAVLSVFNPEYVAYFPALLLLSVGTAAVGAVGPSGSMLMLTGHEGRYLAIIASTVAMRFVAFIVLIPLFGIMGAALATAASFLLMALLLRSSAKALTGVDASVIRLFVRPGDVVAAGVAKLD